MRYTSRRKRKASNGIQVTKGGRSTKWDIKLPVAQADDLAKRISPDEVEFCLPLSPTKNVWTRMHPMAQLRYGKKVKSYAYFFARVLGIKAVWADKVQVSIIRCSEGGVEADIQNVVSGVEKHIDSLMFAGFIEDDNSKHFELGKVQDRTKSQWGEYLGPGTWFRVKRIR